MQWLNLPAWKIGDRVFDARSGIQFSKKQMVLPCRANVFGRKYVLLAVNPHELLV